MKTKSIRRPRLLGNQNARKPDGRAATSFLHIRCTPENKAAWVRAAASNGGLSEWVVQKLNNALE